jgi:hypothetical protein
LAKAYYPSGGSFKEWTPDMVGAAAASHSHNYASADSAGSANTKYSVQVSSTQPTDSRCKLWIKI